MNAFFTDLLHDLREKKLWPVAAVLLLALVAAPALLLKSSSTDSGDPAVAPPAQATADAAEAALVTLADGSTADASDLESFEEKNPFGDGRDAPESTESGGELPTTDELDELLGGSGDAPASGGAPPASSPDAPVSPPSGGGDDTPAKPVAYAYEVDVRFGRRDGEPRLYRGLQRLDVLPRSAAPLLVFLGVSPTGKTAIFLLDSSVSQSGDGRCQPSKDECTFIHLNTERNHNLHFLTTEDGREYAIRLLEIRKERVERRARSSRAARSARGARGARARSAARREKRRRPALGADEIVYER